jgi:hypothetical protein
MFFWLEITAWCNLTFSQKITHKSVKGVFLKTWELVQDATAGFEFVHNEPCVGTYQMGSEAVTSPSVICKPPWLVPY